MYVIVDKYQCLTGDLRECRVGDNNRERAAEGGAFFTLYGKSTGCQICVVWSGTRSSPNVVAVVRCFAEPSGMMEMPVIAKIKDIHRQYTMIIIMTYA